MKKMAAMMMALMLAVMSCCAALAEGTENEGKENPMMTVGGWQINLEDMPVALTEEEQEIFNKAQAGDYTAAALLATQVVAGANYAFLARNENGWAVVTVYRNLQGEASLLSIQPIDLNDVKAAETELPSGLAGGWAVREASNAAVLPEEAHAAFASAALDRALAPIALLGTQLVAGMNYKVLALEDGALCAVTVYQPLTGDAEITETVPFDLLAYVNR